MILIDELKYSRPRNGLMDWPAILAHLSVITTSRESRKYRRPEDVKCEVNKV